MQMPTKLAPATQRICCLEPLTRSTRWMASPAATTSCPVEVSTSIPVGAAGSRQSVSATPSVDVPRVILMTNQLVWHPTNSSLASGRATKP